MSLNPKDLGELISDKTSELTDGIETQDDVPEHLDEKINEKIAEAIIEHLQDNAEILSGIRVNDANGNKIGETAESGSID